MFGSFSASIENRLRAFRLRMRKPTGKVIVFCGAGLSAPSGLSVYRGGSGAWTLHPDAQAAMDMNNWPGSRDAALAHLSQWREQALAAQPNEAHLRLAAWKKAWPEHVHIITQNVDGLLQRAGLSDEEVMEVHGSLHRMRCMACRHEWPLPKGADNGQPCPRCASGMTKPSVVFFHEGAPLYSRMSHICDPDERMGADTFLAIGTSWRVISPQLLMATRGRVLGQQISIDKIAQPELDSWMHAQFEGDVVEGIEWAQKKIFAQWKMG